MRNKLFRKEMSNKSKMSNITKPQNIDTENIVIGEKKMGASGGGWANIQYGGKKLYVQLPKLPTFGAQRDSYDGGAEKLSLAVQFKKADIEEDPKIRDALAGVVDFQNYIKKWARKNSQALFKKKSASEDFVDACFTPFVKKSKDKDTKEEDDRYSMMKLKLNSKRLGEGETDEGVLEPTVFTPEKQKIEINKENVTDVIKRNAHMKCLMTPSLWFAGGNKFGVSWTLFQGTVWEPEEVVVSRDTFCMIESSDEDEDEDDEDKEVVGDESD